MTGNFFVKVYNFVKREFAYDQQVDTSSKTVLYGPKDNFPNELNALVQGSPTATSCLSTYTDFVTGEGFNEGDDLENLVVNKQGMKLFQFHSICSDSLVHNWGVASLVKFNKVGKITEVFDIPFGSCRLGEPDDKGLIAKIHYNPYYGTSLYKKEDIEVYDTYNPNFAVQQLAGNANWKGQIFWYGVRDRKHPFYPFPDYYSARHWMNVEKNAGVYFDENLENGFLQSAIIKMLGDPNDPSGVKDDHGEDIPKGKMFDKEMTTNFSGSKRVSKIMAMWANSKEEFPTLEAFPTNGSADMYRVQDEHATKKITIATKVPGILANVSEGISLGGDGNTIRAAVKLMQQRAKRPQDILINYYQDILKNLATPITDPITIVPYNPFPELESLDPQIWEVLTPEEKRKWVQDHTEVDLIEEDVVKEPETVQNGPVNLFFNSYPKKARENIQRAVDWQKKMNGDCLKTQGMKFGQKIIDGLPLSQSEIGRLSRFLSKNTVHASKPYGEGCESLMYDAWGGTEMMVWANEKIKELSGKAD